MNVREVQNMAVLRLQWKQNHCEVGGRAEARRTSEEAEWQLSGEMEW